MGKGACKICGSRIDQAEHYINKKVYCGRKCKLIMYALREAKKLMKGRIKWKTI